MKQPHILFVCLGNICRSPTAEAVIRKMAGDAGLDIVIDSAGTGAWHSGERPDSRAIAAGQARGYSFDGQAARAVSSTDFGQFDYILAMDRKNLTHLQNMTPRLFSGHVGLFLDFAKGISQKEVPDPYYGGDDGFELVLDLIEAASRGLIEDIKARDWE